MTKKEIKEALQKEYIEALAIFAEYLNTFEEEEQEEALFDLDTIAWETAEENEFTDEWLTIFSALQMAI